MNENLDLTKILKYCPKGWKFYTSVWGEVEFIGFSSESVDFLFNTIVGNIVDVHININGTYCGFGECIIFPSKEQRDWSKFTAPWYKKEIENKFHVGQYVTNGHTGGQITTIEDNYHCYKILDFMGVNTTIPFTLQDNYHLWTINDAKDGDVLAVSWLEDKNLWEKIIIFKKYHNEDVEGYGNTFKNGKKAFTDEEVPYHSKTWTCYLHPATKEQRDLLFQEIKKAGYKWNDENKSLEKLVLKKFDPKTLQPFDKVLVKDDDTCNWRVDFYSNKVESKKFPYMCVGAICKYCIPYNNNTKHLVGTSDEAPEYYRWWDE